ncbi:hypothetical protein V8E55_003220 [Tylopilus felleus]
MLNLKPYTGPTKLVVAFDVGTTFSGISYCILERGQVPEIHGVRRQALLFLGILFPAQALVNGDAKVPSLLYYDKSGNVKAVGAEVLTEHVIEAALTEEWTRAEWWKLHLRPPHLASTINRDNDLPPLPPGKFAIDVLSDFIKYLFRCVKIYIKEHHLAFPWSSVEGSIEFIFTHPNGWEGVPQRLYRQAIELAGLVPSTPEGRSRVHMLTEGEASLHFCVANLLNADIMATDLDAPWGVVIIDAGGGTIDLSMFSMKSNPISCEEVAPAECRLQGSVFVTRRAMPLLEKKLHGWDRFSTELIAEITREFDQTTKLVIKSDQEPAYVRVGNRRTNSPKYNISFGKLKLTGTEATGLFDESIDAVIGAFERQQKFATTPIAMAFLVGGFSTNDWLWSRLQAYFKDRNINICRPDNHINKAVANGAVLSYVDPDNHVVVPHVASSYVQYGVVCALPVDENDEEHIRRKDQWETDSRGDCYVPGYFEGLILARRRNFGIHFRSSEVIQLTLACKLCVYSMLNLKPYTGPTKLVVAFDVGTTFSGISYCILEQGQVPEIYGVRRQQALVNGDAKVPSLLYYDKNGNVRAAGAEVLTESVIETALHEEWTRAEWWKLHLRPPHLASTINRDDNLPPLPSGKSAVDVLTDFVKYLFSCVKIYIKEHHLAFPWSSFEGSIEYIFTHPNGWEGVPQQLYHLAVERAGLVPSTPEGRSRVHMLTEGEAALHYCVANLLNADITATDLDAARGVVIVDAGGGTIDLSMFLMKSNPISCEEIAPAECRLQGSVFVTRRARALLEKKLHGWDHSSAEEIAEFAREFDQTTKLVIKSDQEPAYVRVGGRRTNIPKYNISFGKLKLTGAEATGLFDESINAIIGAFEQQQKSATTPITMAFLVGGLSMNDWLWSRLQSYFKDRNINICRPDNHINKAVANGAVLAHVDRDNHMVASRVARATHGVIRAVPAEGNNEEHIRRRGEWEIDPTGDCYVPNFFEAKLHRGVQVREEMEFRESFSLRKSNPADFGEQVVRLMCYRGALSKPEWIDQDPSSFYPFCNIRVDLSKPAKDLVSKKSASGQVYYQLDYDVLVFFGLTELTAKLSWMTKDGEHRIPAEVSFEGVLSHVDRTLMSLNLTLYRSHYFQCPQRMKG